MTAGGARGAPSSATHGVREKPWLAIAAGACAVALLLAAGAAESAALRWLALAAAVGSALFALSRLGLLRRNSGAPLAQGLGPHAQRAAGAAGEARVAALVGLTGSDAAAAAKLAKQARRGDPVLALRAAERALAAPGLSALERGVMEELLAQARKDARNVGVVVLDERAEAEAAARSSAKRSQPTVDVGALAQGEPAGDDASAAAEPADEAAAMDGQLETSTAFFDRGAVDLTAESPGRWELPDPEASGDGALVDALHAALGAEAAAEAAVAETVVDETSADEAPSSPDSAEPEVLADDTDPRATTTLTLGEVLGPDPTQSERTTVSFRDEEEPPIDPQATKPAPRSDEFAFGEVEDAHFGGVVPESEPEPPPLRPLQVSVGRPERLGREALVLEIEERGRAKLAYEKIDAVAAAGVRGLSSSGKAVLLIDLAIGYTRGEGALRVVRLRADGFDPRELVGGHTSPLAALRALIAELRQRTHGVALPREVDPNAPFRIYADLATYEREAFGAEQKPT